MKSALKIIIAREFLSRVKTKTFILTTLLTPFLFMAVSALPAILMMVSKNDDISKVYVIDQTGKYAPLLKTTDKYEFVNLASKEERQNDKTSAILEISSDLSVDPKGATFFSEKQQPPKELTAYINGVLTDAVRNKKINEFTTQKNIDPAVVADLQAFLKSKDRIDVSTVRLDETGQEKETLGEATSVVSMALTFCMFFFIMMYGQMVVQSVVEEKTNRIIEVIISSVRPFDLMMGKIVGVGLVGILQLIVWVVLGGGAIVFGKMYLGVDITASANTVQTMALLEQQGAGMGELNNILFNINWIQVGACLLLYFIGGYVLFGSLYAMFGSAANDAQEAQQLMMPLTIVLLVAFYTGFAAASNPEGQMAFWCSLIPFTSPVVMMVRSPYEIPIWELLTSVVLLFVTAILMVKLAAKIYRVGILMYGKKASFAEMIKWLKYK